MLQANSRRRTRSDLRPRRAALRVLKVTIPGFYGRQPRTKSNDVAMRAAKPLKYLERLALHNDLFEDDATVPGIAPDNARPRIGIAQPLVVGERPTTAEVIAFMSTMGFAPRQDSAI